MLAQARPEGFPPSPPKAQQDKLQQQTTKPKRALLFTPQTAGIQPNAWDVPPRIGQALSERVLAFFKAIPQLVA
jgi:hypothetical protein